MDQCEWHWRLAHVWGTGERELVSSWVWSVRADVGRALEDNCISSRSASPWPSARERSAPAKSASPRRLLRNICIIIDVISIEFIGKHQWKSNGILCHVNHVKIMSIRYIYQRKSWKNISDKYSILFWAKKVLPNKIWFTIFNHCNDTTLSLFK